jgi:Ca2+-binding EF-hand superfamily protein
VEIQKFIKERAKVAGGTFNYQKAFETFDEDKSGYITLIELKQMLDEFGLLQRLSPKTVQKVGKASEVFDLKPEAPRQEAWRK